MELRHKSFGAVSTPQQSEQKEQTPVVDDLQSLIELGCVKDKVQLGTLNFQLRSLNATERLELGKFLGDNPTGDMLFQFNIKLLALSIESVNGKPLESFHPSYKTNVDVIQLREEIISSMQAPVITKLLEFYNSIAERSDAQFGSEQIKN
ncbi:MAG: hypothetical protein WC516_08215 [Patescibacteria group bacterium]|jgi:hypothetical protein